MNNRLKAALNYRNGNLSVVPLKPNGKVPAVPWVRFQNELASEEQIRQWWERYPDANVGIVTGGISDVVVIDLDSKEAESKLTELLNGCDLSTVPCSQTGKGWHLFFKHPGFKILNRAGVIPETLTTRLSWWA